MDAKINELAKTLIDSHLNDLFEYTEANIFLTVSLFFNELSIKGCCFKNSSLTL